jgi:tRNA A58 N-methylase Trm61
VGLIPATRARIKFNDDIVVIGGLGVSTVAAMEATGRTGTVHTYEASRDQCKITKDTVELNKLNKLNENVTIHHAIVESYHSKQVHGSTDDADVVRPSSLPTGDVLILDCESARVEILESLPHNFRTIIVETHGFLDAPRGCDRRYSLK